MKHLTKLLIASFLICYSCTQHDNELLETKDTLESTEICKMDIHFSQSSMQTFTEEGITEIGIYAYLKDSLVYGKSLPLNNGNLQVELPLGESLQTFAVANAYQLQDVDSISKVVILQDEKMQKCVFVSEIVSFNSDNTIDVLNLELKRLVGQAIFQPTESDVVLNAINHFDQLNVTFTNAGIGYKLSTGECIQQDVTILTTQTTGYLASIYSFPTLLGSSRTAVDVVYCNEGNEVNRTNSPLDTAIVFESSKRSTVYMAILDDDYLTYSWTQTRGVNYQSALVPIFIKEESKF